MRVRRTELAQSDLDGIWFYIAQDNLPAADRMIDRLIDATRPLGDFPDMGAPRDDLGAGMRSMSVGAYLVFYRRRSAEVVIERVLHGRLDIGPDRF